MGSFCQLERTNQTLSIRSLDFEMATIRERQKRTHLLLIAAAAVLVPICAAVPSADAQVLPALPQTFIDTSYPSMSGTSILVPAGGNLQSALNTAQFGDTILLEPGATYLGTFTLPVKSGSGWIVIRTSASDSLLPPPGTRITPAYTSVLPRIVTNSTGPAIQTAAGAHGFRFTGVEITMAAGVNNNLGLVLFGDGSSAQNSLAVVPHDLTLDPPH